MSSHSHHFWKSVLGALLLIAGLALGSSAGPIGGNREGFGLCVAAVSDFGDGVLSQEAPIVKEHFAMAEESDEDDDLDSHSAATELSAPSWRNVAMPRGPTSLVLARKRYLLFCCLKVDC